MGDGTGGAMASEVIAIIRAFAEAIAALIAANGDKDKEEAALMDAADVLFNNLNQRKFGDGSKG